MSTENGKASVEKGMEAESGVRKVDLDTVLVEELGEFGWYQLRTLLLAALVVMFASWGASEFVFTTARIPHRCYIPQCESPTTSDFSPWWLEQAVPAAGAGFDSCRRFVANGSFCVPSSFDSGATEPCDGYVYENTDTVVYDYDLGCDEWRRTIIGSIRTFGTLTALPLTGFVSDRWGRRTGLALNAVNTAWMGLVRYWANTYVGFTVSEFMEATFGTGVFSCAYILLMELVGPKYRVAAGASMNTAFSLGHVTTGLIAWAVPDWRRLTLVLYIPQLITIAYFWIISESIRWYMSKGRYRESEAVLKKVAKVNNKKLSEKSLQALKLNTEEEKRLKTLEEEERKSEPWLIVLVFRNKAVLTRCIVAPVWWVTNTFVNYGMSINAINMVGNRYLNYVAVSAMEIPGYWTAVLLLDRIGRKAVLILAFWVCAACQIAYIFLPADYIGASLTVYLIGKYCIAMVMTSVYVYTTELYPTKYRHSLFAFSSMIGRIGSIVAPLTPAFGEAVWPEFPFALFAGFALVAGALVFLTPETRGAPLPDSMEDAERIGKKQP